MEEVLKQILTELKTLNNRVGGLEEGQKELKSEVTGLKQGQESFKTEVESHFNHLEKAIHKNYFDLEKKIEQSSIDLNTKLDNIYINTVGIAKNFTDTT